MQGAHGALAVQEVGDVAEVGKEDDVLRLADCSCKGAIFRIRAHLLEQDIEGDGGGPGLYQTLRELGMERAWPCLRHKRQIETYRCISVDIDDDDLSRRESHTPQHKQQAEAKLFFVLQPLRQVVDV